MSDLNFTLESTKILIKHIGAVHVNTSLTIVQRKLSNVLLKNALVRIIDDKEHRISMQELLDYIGWSQIAKAPETLREQLRELATIQIQWNILEQDKKNKWTTSALLAHVSIKGGCVYYSYSLALRNLFCNPNIYAKLNLDVQKRFKNKNSIILWEFICGYLSTKKESKSSTDWIEYEKVLTLMDIYGDNYLKRYSSFRDRVLSPSMEEININSDILINYEEKRLNRKISHLRFIGERKNAEEYPEELYEVDVSLLKMKKIGLNEKIIATLREKYSKEEIENAINFFEHFCKSSKKQVNNPVAFFKKTLKEGWIVPKKKTNYNLGMPPAENQIQETDELLIELRKKIASTIGKTEYDLWFSSIKLEIADETVFLICRSNFMRDHAETKFSHIIKKIVASIGGERVKYHEFIVAKPAQDQEK